MIKLFWGNKHRHGMNFYSTQGSGGCWISIVILAPTAGTATQWYLTQLDSELMSVNAGPRFDELELIVDL